MIQDVGPTEVGEALARIFARPEFAERTPPALLQWIQDTWAVIRSWLWSLLPRALDAWPPFLSWLIVGLFAAAAVWAALRLIGPPRTRRLAMPTARREAGAEARDATWWEAAAREAATHGRFRDAARALYVAAVLRLEERGLVRFVAGKTPGDYRREVRSDDAVRSAFDGFVRQFLPVAFGARVPDATAFDALRSAAAELGVHA